MINTSNVTTADLLAANGVVHVLDKVLIPTTVGVTENDANFVQIYPNPSSDILNIMNVENKFSRIKLVDAQGRIVLEADLNDQLNQINLNTLNSGYYTVRFEGTNSIVTKNLLITSQK